MEAFVPCGAALTSSRSFLTGGAAISPNRRTVHARPAAAGVPEISAIKLPFDLGKMFKDAFSSGSSGVTSANSSASAATTAPAVPAESVKLSVGGKEVAPQPVEEVAAPPRPGSMFEKRVPKFYNDATARHQFSAVAAGQCATAFDVRNGFSGVKAGNARDNDQGGFRNMDLYTDDLVWARPGWSSDEARVGVRVALRNVFGNANLFESDMDELAYSISCVTDTADMREFVRALGLSDAYRRRFFEGCSNMRFVELNFKHFLGRAPHDRAEVSSQIEILATQGYKAAINAMIDSAEYDRLFGRSRVPSVNFRGGHPYNSDMNKIAVLNGSYLSSDRVSTKALLETGDSSAFSSFTVFKGLPEAWRGENKARSDAGPLMAFPDTLFWNLPPPGVQKAALEWNLRFGKWTKFWYKDSIVYEEVMTPKLTHSEQEKEEAAAVLKYGSLMGSSYVGTRKIFDMAPVITIEEPRGADFPGRIGVQMQTIEPVVPRELSQTL